MKISKDFMDPWKKKIERPLRKTTEEEKVKMKTPVSPEHQNIYYVYVCHVDGVLRYIGMGKGNRSRHCVSGKSSCSELNKDFHAGKDLVVTKVAEKLTQSEAQGIETDMIWEEKDNGIYNKLLNPNMASQPLLSKVRGVIIDQEATHEDFYKQLAKVSPNIDEHSYENLSHWLHRCGLTIHLASVGNNKTLVLDKGYSDAFSYLHAGCPNFPNCAIVGTCGK